jgi:capsular polysaccharide export protein
MNAFGEFHGRPHLADLSKDCGNAWKQITQSSFHPKALLLQGPVGPFFSNLQKALLGRGFSVRRVLLNAGDRLFGGRDDCVQFMGTAPEWETWLRFELAQNRPDIIVMFGSTRPAHETARRLAKYFDIQVVCLEEGYLRSGYISCELGGNNQNSPMVNWQPDSTTVSATHHTLKHHSKQGSSFFIMSVWGTLYYLARDSFSAPSEESLFHRPRERLLPLTFSWVVHGMRRIAARTYERPMLHGLRHAPGYILVPLQVSSDSQLQTAARGWNTRKLIEVCLRALVLSEKTYQRVVFKLHPLERSGPEIKRLILRCVKAMSLPIQCVRIVSSGRISDLARDSSGMVVINSTSAFSALHHDIPVLVLGDAVYRHEGVVTVGESEADVAAFFKLRRTKSRELIDAFLADLKSQSLLPGDFYAKSGREVAVSEVIAKIKDLTSSRSCKEANA